MYLLSYWYLKRFTSTTRLLGDIVHGRLVVELIFSSSIFFFALQLGVLFSLILEALLTKATSGLRSSSSITLVSSVTMHDLVI